MAPTFRPATLDDADLLFQWRNDPITRQNSRQTAEIDHPTHLKWLAEAIQNPKRKLFIAFANKTPIGTVRFDQQNELTWELSWTIAKESRGQGFGKEMVKVATTLMPKNNLIAVIKDNNQASTKIATYAGFVFDKQVGDTAHWILKR